MNQDNFDLNFGREFSLDENQEYFKLPEFVQCDFNGNRQPNNVCKYHQTKIKENLSKLPENIRGSTQQVVQALGQYLKIWDIPPVTNIHEDNCYVFNLPPSFFYGNCEIFPVRPDLLRNEYNQVQELTSGQISQIFDSGTFEMPSQQFPIPYVWQLSQFIMKGRRNIKQSYYNDIGVAYKLIRSTPTYFYSEKDYTGGPCTLRSAFYNLCCKLCVFGSILVGFRETYTYVDKTYLENQVEKKRQLQLRQIENLNFTIYQYLKYTNELLEYEQAAEKRMKFVEAYKFLEQQLQGLRLQIQNQYDTLIEQQSQNQRFDDQEERKEYLENLNDQLKLLEEDYINKYQIILSVNSRVDQQIEDAAVKAQQIFLHNYFPSEEQVVLHLISLVECKRSKQYYKELKNDEISSQVTEFEQKLIREHPIRKHSNLYIQSEKQRFEANIKTQLNEKYRIQLVQDLKAQNIKDVEVYIQFQSVKKLLKTEVESLIKNEEAQRRRPNIDNTVVRMCFPPYKVTKVGAFYQLEREVTYNVNSRCFFWKLQLILIRYFAWTVNVMYWLFANGIQGPLGIRALVSCSIYHPDVTIDTHTGVVHPTHYSVTPIIIHLQNVCDGMQASRREFENSPDTGFFGKNCARLFNLIEVYFFRLIIVGIIGVLIIMPVLILINFCISIFLALTAWAWIPVVLVFLLLISILFYDFDVENRNENNIYSSPVCLPLFVNLWNLVIRGVLMFVINLLMVCFILPIAGLFMVVFGHLRYILRSLYDCFMIILVRCLGRVPASENSLAWKISGPGISRSYYFSIKNEEAIILVAAELERCILSEYQTRMKKKIMQPQQDLQSIMSTFFSLFGASYMFQDPGSTRLNNCLSRQIDLRNCCLPSISNTIRFTANELQLLMMQTKQFIKNQIRLKNMNSFIWISFNVQKGDYKLLTETILTKIFGTKLMQPLEALDIRFQLQTAENHQLELKIQKALKGQVNLSKPENHFEYEILPGQGKTFYKKYINYKEILDEIWSCQSFKQTWSSISSKYKRFYVNYCLQGGLD